MICYLFCLAPQQRGEAKSESLHSSHLQHKYDLGPLWAESCVSLSNWTPVRTSPFCPKMLLTAQLQKTERKAHAHSRLPRGCPCTHSKTGSHSGIHECVLAWKFPCVQETKMICIRTTGGSPCLSSLWNMYSRDSFLAWDVILPIEQVFSEQALFWALGSLGYGRSFCPPATYIPVGEEEPKIY